MSALTKLVETTVLADLNLDSTIASYTPKEHDARTNLDAKVTVTVTALDKGELAAGSGINKVRVEVGINVNEKADNVTAGTLDDLEQRVCVRLPVQLRTETVQAALAPPSERLSSSSLKVFGVMAAEPTPREDAGLIRSRTVVRTLACAQLA